MIFLLYLWTYIYDIRLPVCFSVLLLNIYIMTKIKYTLEQIKELKQNPAIENCTDLNVMYSVDTKIKWVELWRSWLCAKDVFKKLGIPDYIIHSRIPARNLGKWEKIMNNKWIRGFTHSKRWRKKWSTIIRMESLSQDKLIEFLKAKVAYLEEENKVLMWVKKRFYKRAKDLISYINYQINIWLLIYVA